MMPCCRRRKIEASADLLKAFNLKRGLEAQADNRFRAPFLPSLASPRVLVQVALAAALLMLSAPMSHPSHLFFDSSKLSDRFLA